MNINNKLITFAQQELVLSHNETERERIKASLLQLEKVLKDKLAGNIKEFIRFGSYTRNTILPRKYDQNSDIDLMVVFNTSTNKYNPGTYRKKILDIVSASYPNSVSKKDFPVIKLELNHIMFDIVPAYSESRAFGNRMYYYIPDSADAWRYTEPNDINERLANRNQYYENNTVRNVVRLCKHWNASKGYPFESYLMEKDLIELSYGGNDTYSGFLYALNRLAGGDAGVRQALERINQYKGGWFSTADEKREFEWVQRLLPGLGS